MSTSDRVMRALGNNTALVFIHSFGSHASVTVVNASTNKGICLIESRGYTDETGHMYRVYSKGMADTVAEKNLKVYVTGLTHFPRNCTKRNRNYAHAVLKGA